MADTPYPIPRELRQTGILTGDGVNATYGPFAFKIFDEDDVTVYWRAAASATFVVAFATVAKVSELPQDYFTVTFPDPLPGTTEFVVTGDRLHERTAGVTKGVQLDPTALEKELSKQGTILQEGRRDLNRALKVDFGTGEQLLPKPDGVSLIGWDGGGKLVNRPSMDTSVGLAEGAAAAALAAANAGFVFNTEAAFLSGNIPVILQFVRTAGYYSAGDGGGHTKKRISAPSSVKAWHRQSADGAWWEISESTITPQMFGAKAGDMTFNSGPAIQSAYDMAFSVASVKAVSHRGHCYSQQSLSPTLAQGANPGNFDMPFDLEFDGAIIEFVGTGHGGEIAWYITNNTNQRGVSYGRISGNLIVLINGDWRDGISLKGCNWWVNSGRIQIGQKDNSAPNGGASKSPSRHGVRFESNNGKGGLWNKWGAIMAFGGQIPVWIGAIANSNSFDHIFGGYGTTGNFFNAGDRNTIKHLALEMGDPLSVQYMLQNAGQQTVIDNFEAEKVSSDPVSGSFKATIYCSAGALKISGGFYALGSGAPYLVDSGAFLDFTHINHVSTIKRIERICVPPTWERSIAVRSPYEREVITLSGIGVSGANGTYNSVLSAGGIYCILPLRLYLSNNTSASLDFDILFVHSDGALSAPFTVTRAAGTQGAVALDDLMSLTDDGKSVDEIRVRAKTAAASFTGNATASLVALKL